LPWRPPERKILIQDSKFKIQKITALPLDYSFPRLSSLAFGFGAPNGACFWFWYNFMPKPKDEQGPGPCENLQQKHSGRWVRPE